MKWQPIRLGIASLVIAGMTVAGVGATAKPAEAAPVVKWNFSAPVKIDNNALKQIADKYGINLDDINLGNIDLGGIDLGQGNCFPNLPGQPGGANGGNGGADQGKAGNGGADQGNAGNGGANQGNAGNGNNGSNGNAGNTGGSTVAQDQFAQQVVTLVNQERAKAGLPALQSDPLLTKVALEKAKDMSINNYFSHTSPTYGSPFDMMRSFGVKYSYAGENIASGQRSPQEVMDAWMNSSGHRANILSKNFTKIGVAYYKGQWVQMFIG
mgnify:CR=1 FL=1|jgi:uncharacterized protein, YkwD family